MLKQLLQSIWHFPNSNSIGIYLNQKNGVYIARYSLTRLRATGASADDAIKMLKQKSVARGMTKDDISWLQTQRLLSGIIIVFGLILTAQTMASTFPKYVLNSLQRNRNEHLQQLNKISPESKEAYMERLCRTMLFLRYGDEKKPGVIPNSRICDNMPLK